MATPPGPSAADLAAAQAYERLLVPGLFMPSTRRAVARAAPQPGERLLDLACGTGVGACMAEARLGAQGMAAGVDVDAAMLRVARGTSARVCWLQASALRLPLKDAAFDVVLCLQGLQFMNDRALALREAHRVLRPGGRLVVTTWGPLDSMPGHAAVYAALDAQGIDTASPRRGFELGVDALRALVQAAGFGAVDVSAADDDASFASAGAFVDGLMLGAPYTRRVLAALPAPVRRACARDAVQRLGGASARGPLVLPTRCLLLLACRPA
jgi:SAM-dependent methyltransferase